MFMNSNRDNDWIKALLYNQIRIGEDSIEELTVYAVMEEETQECRRTKDSK